MKKVIQTEFHSLQSFLELKEAAWEVCQQLYNMEEEEYYARLAIFHSFAVFKSEGKIVGFLSFFLDETVLHNRKMVLLGVGHGAILPAYRNHSLIPAATIRFLLKSMWKRPFRKHLLWGMGMTHLAYRMGRRSSASFYPMPDQDCPPYFQTILDWLGQKYYPNTYNKATLTATVSFSILDQAAIPKPTELEDPVVADFVRRVPSCLQPNNRTGVMTITPIAPNVWFWIKKYVFGNKF